MAAVPLWVPIMTFFVGLVFAGFGAIALAVHVKNKCEDKLANIRRVDDYRALPHGKKDTLYVKSIGNQMEFNAGAGYVMLLVEQNFWFGTTYKERRFRAAEWDSQRRCLVSPTYTDAVFSQIAKLKEENNLLENNLSDAYAERDRNVHEPGRVLGESMDRVKDLAAAIAPLTMSKDKGKTSTQVRR